MLLIKSISKFPLSKISPKFSLMGIKSLKKFKWPAVLIANIQSLHYLRLGLFKLTKNIKMQMLWEWSVPIASPNSTAIIYHFLTTIFFVSAFRMGIFWAQDCMKEHFFTSISLTSPFEVFSIGQIQNRGQDVFIFIYIIIKKKK